MTLVVEISSHVSRVKEKLERLVIEGKLVGKLQIPPQKKGGVPAETTAFSGHLKQTDLTLPVGDSSSDLAKAVLLFFPE